MEAIVVSALFFGALTTIVKMSLDYQREKWKARLGAGVGTGGDRSMGTNELRGLIREAVEEANAPLVARLEAVEERADPDRAIRVGRLSA